MSVFIQQENALALLTQMEGEDWQKQQASWPTSFEAFLAEWRAHPALVNEEGYVAVRDNRMLYGNGGWNRYYVALSGEIVFVEGYCERPDDLTRAKELGFRIVP